MEGITDSKDLTLSKLQEMVNDTEAWHAAVHRVTELEVTEQLNNKYFRCLLNVQLFHFPIRI